MQLLKLNQSNSTLLQHLLYKHLALCLSRGGANYLWFAWPASIPPMSKLNPKFLMFFSLPANNRIQLVQSLLNIISRYFLVFGLINIITFFFLFGLLNIIRASFLLTSLLVQMLVNSHSLWADLTNFLTATAWQGGAASSTIRPGRGRRVKTVGLKGRPAEVG